MKLLNCSLQEVEKRFVNRKIVFFGCGSWLQAINYTDLMKLKKQFAYVIDNGVREKVDLGGIQLSVYSPQKIMEELNCVIILTSPIYMYDMYCQLEEMNLNDEIECFAFPFMQMISKQEIDKSLLNEVLICKKQMIPRIIHSFWFSGDKKPEAYQRCVDTWKERLDGYEIIEWNKDNYDWHKHPFVERAVELGAWAFASDYARLDVLNEYGGIYLDMDVEVFKSFDNLLGNDAILSFSNQILVDLAMVGSKKNNIIIQQMLRLYDTVEIPNEKREFARFFQPSFVRSVLVKNGIKMNGVLQKIRNATVFPSEFFMPQDHILFRSFVPNANTYCVHYDNFGWSFSTDNKREKKIRDNNILWGLIEKNDRN